MGQWISYNETTAGKKGDVIMGFFILFIAIVILGLTLTEGKTKKGFIALLVAIIYFPIGVIIELMKNYK